MFGAFVCNCRLENMQRRSHNGPMHCCNKTCDGCSAHNLGMIWPSQFRQTITIQHSPIQFSHHQSNSAITILPSLMMMVVAVVVMMVMMAMQFRQAIAIQQPPIQFSHHQFHSAIAILPSLMMMMR